ncbi:NAD dependent epimerase/dehydratase family protein [Hypoxylon trugodes]|uniref:NAD dependent epimerase/dehydratase family protein n=1 Tax=Hypoxylon trugodes TaxID=326681 RepID=UPI00219F771C|nr:NAD dependent epimerase/dehydratase family protein [Hypoxylon trugodes]KAI1386151.1 NAD dependent epimerase/dehydratase family protein [Hypoxylon trugodes]
MSSSETPQILLTGAFGYIGGTILSYLISSDSPVLSASTITCLVRGPDRAAKLTETYGSRVRIILYKDLDDVEAATAAAAQHDLVINTTNGFHTPSAVALIKGLAQRKASTGRDVWYIQTSGTSNLSDRPVTGLWKEPEGREFDDVKDDVYGYEKSREENDHKYFQRTTELTVVDTSLEYGVKTVVIMSGLIFGRGKGLFNKDSIQIPDVVRAALKRKRTAVPGHGKGVWDHVHVEDLAELYVLLARQIVEKGGEGVPTGKKGIIFSGNGRHAWEEVAQRVADAAYAEGAIAQKEVEHLELSEAAKIFLGGQGGEEFVELALASNSRTVASVAKNLGWKPTRGEEAWKATFKEAVKAELEKL